MAEADSSGLAGKPERRRTQRFRCQAGIVIQWGSAALNGSVVDISKDGMFVEISDPLWIGARFAAELELEPPADVECVVRRVEPLRGMALTYSTRNHAARAAVEALFEKLGRS